MSRPIGPHPSDSPLPGPPEEGEFQTGRVATIAGGHAVHDTFTGFLAPLLPSFIEKFSLTNAAAGALSSFLQFPGLLQWAIGHAADRTSLRWVVVMAPAVTGTLMASLGWAPTYALLAVMLMMAGTSVAAFHAVAPVAIGRLSGTRIGKGMGFFMVGGETGRTLGPIVVAVTLTYLSFKQLAFLAVAGIATSATLHVLLRGVPLRTRGDGEPVPSRTALRSMWRLMAVLSGLTIFRSLAMSALTLFLAVYMIEQGFSLWLAGAALSIVEGAGMGGALAGGWISDHLGRRNVMLFSHVATPAALFLFLAVHGWMQIVVLPVIGLTMFTVTPALLAMVQEECPDSRAFANGTYLSLNFAIRSVAAVVFGAFGDAFGLTTAIVVGAFAMLAAIPLIWLLPERHRTARADTGS